MSGKVTAEMIKELRERTNVAMGKCKEALDQAGGDMEKAIDILRKAGIASAVKKEGRETNEGCIGYAENPSTVALIEANAETDFVTQNEKFKTFLKDLCMEAAETKPASLEAFMNQPLRKDKGTTVDQYRAQVMQTLGENIRVRRLKTMPKANDISIGIYSHMGGKIVCVVELTGGSGNEALARDIAMHAAAESPDYVRPEEIPGDVKAREEEVAKGQIKGKPANIIEKIVEGKIKAFYDQVCLLNQKYVKDTDITVAQLLEQESKHLGKNLGIRSFLRWKVGG